MVFPRVGLARGGGGVITAGASEVRERVRFEQQRAVLGEPGTRHDAVWKRLPGHRVNRRGQTRTTEIPGAFLSSRHCAQLRLTPVVVLPFLAGEEEELAAIGVPFARNEDGAAERPTEVVEAERLFACGEKRAGVEDIVADEFKDCPMELAAAALGHNVEHRARAPAELRVVAGGQNLDLGDRVQARDNNGVAVGAVVQIVRPVYVEVDRIAANAVDARAGGRESEVERIGDGRNRAWEQLQKLRVVPAVQWNLADLSAGDRAAYLARSSLHLIGRGGDRDGVSDRADFELEINRPARGRVENHTFTLGYFETAAFSAEIVGAGRQTRKDVIPAAVRVDGLLQSGLDVGGRDCTGGDRRAG